MSATLAEHNATDPPWRYCLRDESAATAVEYALLGALAAVIGLAGLSLFGEAATELLADVARKILAAINPPSPATNPPSPE